MSTILDLQKPEDLATAKSLVVTARGQNPGEPVLVTYGYLNQVLIYEAAGVVARFPRDSGAAERLRLEAENLEKIATVNLPVTVPRFLHLSTEPTWLLTTYVPGIAHSRVDITSWTEAQKQSLGTDLADFLFRLHTGLDVNSWRQQDSLLSQFEKDIYECPERDQQHSVALKELSSLKDMIARSPTPESVLYGDVHGANLIFDTTLKLVGVVDFADMHVGTVYEELRRVYMMDKVIFEAAKTQYESRTAENIDETLVRQWAIVHELAVLCRHANEPDYPSIPRAKAHLHEWQVL